MSLDDPPQGAVSASRLQQDLGEVIVPLLNERGLDDPVALADALGILPITSKGLLRRSEWSLDTALWLIERLELPISVDVRINGR